MKSIFFSPFPWAVKIDDDDSSFQEYDDDEEDEKATSNLMSM